MTLLLCKNQKENLSNIEIQFKKLVTVNLQAVLIKNAKIMFLCVQLMK